MLDRLRRLLARHGPAAAAPLAYLVLTLLVYWPLWTPIEGARATWRYDARWDYWGDLILHWRTLADGHLALWDPFDRTGHPLYGDPHPGVLYPPNWPLYLWGFATGAVPFFAVTIKILAHHLFGAVGMHLLLRRMRAAEPACYLGGILFSFTSPKLRYGGSALNWSHAWAPWLLLAIHAFAERPDGRRAILVGTAAAMLLLAGGPASALYAAVVAVPFGFALLWGRVRPSLPAILAACAVALLWVLPLVASNVELLGQSVRETRDLEFVTFSAFTPGELLGYLVPRLGGGENPHVGLLPLLAVGLFCAAGRRRELILLAVAIAGLLLALGHHTGVQPAVASAIPPFALFRRAHRYLYVVEAALPILAALGMSHALALTDPDKRSAYARRVGWIGGAAALALGIAWVVSVATEERIAAVRNTSFALAFISAAAGTGLVVLLLAGAERTRRFAARIAVAAVFVDVWTANSIVVKESLEPPVRTPNDGLIAELPADFTREARIYDRGYLKYRPGVRLGIRDFGGYEDDPLGLVRYRTFLEAARRNLPLLGHANVAYYLDGNAQPPVRPRPSDGLVAVKPNVYRLPRVAPAVYYVPRADVAASPRDALLRLPRIPPGQGAVVEGKPPPQGPPGAAPAAGALTVLEPNRAVAEIETPGPGLVVVVEAYYPAWRAEVDGQEAPIQPANVLFRGVPVASAGKHVIEMRLRPLRYWGLIPAYLAALALLGWVAIGAVVGPRRRGSGSAVREGPAPDQEHRAPEGQAHPLE